MSPFDVGDDLRTNPFQEEGNDANQGTVTKEAFQVPIGPVTRARAKRFKNALCGLIQSIWTEINSWMPKNDVPCGPQDWISIIQPLEYSRKGPPKGIAQGMHELQASFLIWVTYPFLTHQRE